MASLLRKPAEAKRCRDATSQNHKKPRGNIPVAARLHHVLELGLGIGLGETIGSEQRILAADFQPSLAGYDCLNARGASKSWPLPCTLTHLSWLLFLVFDSERLRTYLFLSWQKI